MPALARIDPRAAVYAGLSAGTVFLLLEMALVATVGGGSPWAPPRMMAAIAMGPSVLPPPATFDAAVVAVAMAVHFALSVVLALVFALAVAAARLSAAGAAMAGIAFGLLVYVVDFHLFTAMFPWFAMARNAITIGAHVAFGLVLGWGYARLVRGAAARAADGPAG